jgi:hypothetical protein
MKYLQFIDPQDTKKYYIYEYIIGQGDMALYRKGDVIGKKTIFDRESNVQGVPLGTLKYMMYRGHELKTYPSYDDLEAELFMEALEDF